MPHAYSSIILLCDEVLGFLLLVETAPADLSQRLITRRHHETPNLVPAGPTLQSGSLRLEEEDLFWWPYKLLGNNCNAAAAANTTTTTQTGNPTTP